MRRSDARTRGRRSVTYTMSPESLAKALEAAARAVTRAKPAAVRRSTSTEAAPIWMRSAAVAGDLPLIEDCAQAHGAAL